MFFGSIPALITPFNNEKIDYESFYKIIEWSIEQGSHGFVPCGTTGESPTLSHQEHKKVIEECIKIVDKRVPVIAGTGSNNTFEAIDFTNHAEKNGADAALVVTPYYNKPTQEGLYSHYKKISDSTNLPIIIYNIPGRSVVDMSIETMAKLSKLNNIVGVKDATQDLARPMATRLAIDQEFCLLSGEDATTIPFLAGGGNGCISVSANVAPRQCSEMHRAWRDGDMPTCLELQDRLMPLHFALFCESSPGPVKYAASLLDKCLPDTRLPLTRISDSSKEKVHEAMVSVGLLN